LQKTQAETSLTGHNRRIVVCGFGAITSVGCLGLITEEFWNSIKQGVSGFQSIGEYFASKKIDARDKDIRASTVAAVRDFDPARFLRPDFLRENRRLDPSILYGLSAAALAMEMSGLKVGEENSRKIGVKVGTGLGGGQSFESSLGQFRRRGRSKQLYNSVQNVMGNATAGYASLYFGLRGSSSTSMAACASSAYAVTEACDKILLGKVDAMLVIGTEASTTPFIIACFDSMGLESGALSRKPGGSLPFSLDRDGFVIGEGAGAILLAERKWAQQNRLEPLAEILGYWENAGAAHMVQPNPKEAACCMRQAIADAGLETKRIDYINAHATATPIGDLAETEAIWEVFMEPYVENGRGPYINSTKALIGHTCGASGILELIITILSLRDGFVHSMGDYDPDPSCLSHDKSAHGKSLAIVSREPVKDNLRYALTNSFGFGDENASIVVGPC
jgi:3-oxoacyl-[acyl-carrier-protein] synthase II